MEDVRIYRNDEVVPDRWGIHIPRKYMNEDEARDFMEYMNRMRSFKLAFVEYVVDGYNYVGHYLYSSEAGIRALKKRVEKLYDLFKEEQPLFAGFD